MREMNTVTDRLNGCPHITIHLNLKNICYNVITKYYENFDKREKQAILLN